MVRPGNPAPRPETRSTATPRRAYPHMVDIQAKSSSHSQTRSSQIKNATVVLEPSYDRDGEGFRMPPGTAGGVPRGAAFESRPCTNPRGWLDYGDLTTVPGLVAAPGGRILLPTIMPGASWAVFGGAFELNWLLPGTDFGAPDVAGAANWAGSTALAIAKSRAALTWLVRWPCRVTMRSSGLETADAAAHGAAVSAGRFR